MNFQWTNKQGHIRTSRIICVFLILDIIIAIIVYMAMVSRNGEEVLQQSYGLESKFEVNREGEKCFTGQKLNDEIRKLAKMKASLKKDLRDMEGKRLQIQSQMTQYQEETNTKRTTKGNIKQKIKQLGRSLNKLTLRGEEFSQKRLAPKRIPTGQKSESKLCSASSFHSCRMHSCFDYARCSILSGFNVYFYDPFQYTLHTPFIKFIHMSVASSLAASPYITIDPSKACLFLVLVGQLEKSLDGDQKSIENFLKTLPHWNEDGKNHVIINLIQNSKGRNMFNGVDTGRAMIVQSTAVYSNFRPKFDIIVPPSIGKAEGDVWEELPMISPIRRTYFLSFWGQLRGAGSQSKIQNEELDRIKEQRSEEISWEAENVLVSALKDIQHVDQRDVFIKSSCDSILPGAINGEWSICGTDLQRKDLLIKSTFSLILAPANTSYVSSTVFQLRLYESLKHGAVPVILGDYVELPFSDVLDWMKAVIILPKARAPELYFMLRTYTDNSIAELKQMGRYYFETYLVHPVV